MCVIVLVQFTCSTFIKFSPFLVVDNSLNGVLLQRLREGGWKRKSGEMPINIFIDYTEKSWNNNINRQHSKLLYQILIDSNCYQTKSSNQGVLQFIFIVPGNYIFQYLQKLITRLNQREQLVIHSDGIDGSVFWIWVLSIFQNSTREGGGIRHA